MNATDARVDVLAAAVRAIALTLTPQQAALAEAVMRREVQCLAAQRLPPAVDHAAADEVLAVLAALGRMSRDEELSAARA